jgi:hypothetical protein
MLAAAFKTQHQQCTLIWNLMLAKLTTKAVSKNRLFQTSDMLKHVEGIF